MPTIDLVSAADGDYADESISGNGPSSQQRISADGRYVVFQSDATNLVPGDDTMQTEGAIDLSVWLYGQAGNDKLRGGGGNDILVGGPGNDLLVGKSGRDFLVGGLGADRIIGNSGNDMLIAGAIGFGESAIAGIMQRWNASDGSLVRQAAIEQFIAQ